MFALVTGAGGLLGQHLTLELCRRGYRVRALDIKAAVFPKEVEYVRGDIRNPESARSACSGVDVVFHLAGLLPQSKAPAEKLHSVNVRGTENMLAAAVSESVKRFVYSSSVEIYGVLDQTPCTEDSPKKLLGPYSRTKLDCEELCAKYSADFGIESVVLRLPMIAGPGYYHEKFFTKMFRDLARGKTIRIIGDGSNRYQVVACSDAVEGCILASESPNAAGEAFNIASDPDAVPPVRDMLEQVIRRVGSKSKISHINKALARAVIKLASAVGRPLLLKDYHEVAFLDYLFSIDKARQLLRYAPKKDNVEALVETVEWYWKTKGLSP
jgi:nucleoside-diphosphate-sugar epimerase